MVKKRLSLWKFICLGLTFFPALYVLHQRVHSELHLQRVYNLSPYADNHDSHTPQQYLANHPWGISTACCMTDQSALFLQTFSDIRRGIDKICAQVAGPIDMPALLTNPRNIFGAYWPEALIPSRMALIRFLCFLPSSINTVR